MNPDPLPGSPNTKAIYEQRRLEIIAARWDAKAADWDRNLEDPACHLNEDHAYDRFLDRLAMVIQQRPDFCAQHGVIDAGCATGLVLAKAITHFSWGIGVDISPEMIKLARVKHIPGARFLIGDCFDLASSCPKAGAIVSRGVLLSHYGPDQGEALLRSAYVSLVQGGFILWDFLNLASCDSYRHSPKTKAFFDPEHVHRLALRAGFHSATTLGEAERRVRLLFAERD